MKYNFYIDVFFLINSVMNIILLYNLKIVMKLEGSNIHIIAGGLSGAALSCLMVFLPVRYTHGVQFLYGILTSLVMVTVSFGLLSWKQTVREAMGLYLVTAVYGGIAVMITQNHVDGLSLLGWFLLMTGTCLCVRYLWISFSEIQKRRKYICNVILHYNGKEEKVLALWDTGNHMIDPVSCRPVHILTFAACSRICTCVSAVRYIPYQSVGRKNGLLPAIVMDFMELEQNGKKRVIDRPLIAVCRHALSPDGAYEMLLNGLEN